MKETILLYNISRQPVLDLYQSICQEHNIELKLVPAEEYTVPVGFLAYGTREQKAPYINGTKKASVENAEISEAGRNPFDEPMMVFGGFTGPRLNQILKVFRESGLAGIPLKAMLTEYNAVWDSMTLYGQLSEERAAFARMKE
ncbi:MAG: DUF3783 domain-containing protein [Eubacterium sp.]|nr:DUF3783 domain-containing protein [Eubacterium sp.]